ncbi:hypothetical protein PCANC_21132 [Puccinia coronata f. sp. avenae]|uniref:Major facilitator superfamily (MFS) profile domain-containing protein n=1 Tax=Puccinia coronata f. sp. avenae TaxID=200324 RepID=A0A2N5SNC0_9BASI|nr:hypothetical protein PCANC_21132 [Puccinia coronata f. sp. avenae]
MSCSESSALLISDHTTHHKNGRRDTTARWRGIVRELWVIYLIYFTIAAFSTMRVGPKLHLLTEMICDSGVSWGQPAIKHGFTFLGCQSSVAVNSDVTWLLTIESITLGLSSALCTGYWSRFSQNTSRSTGLLILFLGIALNELIFILVTRFKWPVMVLPIGSLVEGILGGPATLNTLITAYLYNRLTQYQLSTATGLLLAAGTAMVGSAIGPSLSNELIAFSGGEFLTPAYAILALLLALGILTRCFLPHDELAPCTRSYPADLDAHQRTGFFSPFHVLKPIIYGNNSLLLLAISYGLYYFVAASATVKLQYAALNFHWDTVQTGRYLTMLGASRVISLLVIIPSILYLWNRKAKKHHEIPGSVDALSVRGPILDGADNFRYGSIAEDFSDPSPQANSSTLPFGCPSTNTSQSSLTLCPSEVDEDQEVATWKPMISNQPLKSNAPPSAFKSRQGYQINVDFNLARFSIGWGVVCCVCLVFSRGMLSFLIPSALETLAGSTGPAVQAVALSLLTIKHTHLASADLISSFSLIKILMYDLFGPLVFGTVYIHSSSHSQASRKSFFVLIAGLELTNLTLINFVKTSVHDDSNPTTTTSAADLEEG